MNHLTDDEMSKLTEILVITQEESAELIQAISKCFRFGFDDKNRERLTQELGDVLMMIDLIRSYMEISDWTIDEAKRNKSVKLGNYSGLYK